MKTMGIGLARLIVALLCVVAFAGCGSGTDDVGSDVGSDSPAPSYESGYTSDNDSDAVAQEEWDNQEGTAWDDFNTSYSEGWEAGCDIAFEGSPDGSLYDQGDEYTADDCYALAPFDASDADIPYEVPSDPYSEGRDLGESDGCAAAFEELPTYGVLNWGEDSYDDSVCP